MRDGTVIVAQAFFGLLEVAPDDLAERINADFSVGIERVIIVDRDQSWGLVPGMLLEHLVVGADVRERNVVLAEETTIEIGIFIPVGGIGEEAQSLVVFDSEGGLLGHIGGVQLRGPIAVVGLEQRLSGVVQQAGEDNLLWH